MPQQHTALNKSLFYDFTSLLKLWSRQTGWKSFGQGGFERRHKEDDARCCSFGVELFKRIKQKHREDPCSHFTAKQNAQSSVCSPLCSASNMGSLYMIWRGHSACCFFPVSTFYLSYFINLFGEASGCRGGARLPSCGCCKTCRGSAGKVIKHN